MGLEGLQNETLILRERSSELDRRHFKEQVQEHIKLKRFDKDAC